MTRAASDIRAYEVEARKKALDGARLAIKEGVSLPEAAKRSDASYDSVTRIHTVLRYGTPEEIATIETGLTALRPVYDAVNARLTPEGRQRERKPNPGAKMGSDARALRDTEIALWQKLRDALDNIAALPQPADMVRIIKKHRMREGKVNEKLITAFAWITEFSDAWTS